MPIIIDPTLPEPASPARYVSADGILTVLVDATHAGALLVADFTAPLNDNPGFENDAAGWELTSAGTATLTRSSDVAHTGMASGLIAPDGATAYPALLLSATAAAKVTPSVDYLASAWVYAPAGYAAVRIRLDWRDANTVIFASTDTVEATVPAGEWVHLTLTAAAPEGAAAASVRLILVNTPAVSDLVYVDDARITRAGVVVTSSAVDVTFTRTNPDGTTSPVRSGDPAAAPGGVAVAYDHEATLGQAVAWHAATDRGVASDGVAMLLPAPELPRDVWLKSLNWPHLSLQLQVSSWPSLATSTQATTEAVWGRAAPHATYGVRSAAESEITFETDTLDQRTGMIALLDSGMLLVQTRPEYGRPDQYVLITDVTEELAGIADNPGRHWKCTVVEVLPEDTSGAALRIPDKSYADRLAAYPTYGDVPHRAYLDALTG